MRAQEEQAPAIVIRVLEAGRTPRDLVQLETLRKGLDGISALRSWAEAC